jgi:hypothetical protein
VIGRDVAPAFSTGFLPGVYGVSFAPRVPMRLGTCARLLCAWTLIATPVAAQTTTEDGIRAVLGGDYRAAVRILKPLADAAEHPDPVAQFFLAVLYDAGKGVHADMGRACGLYLRSASHPHAFSDQAATIGAMIRDQLGNGASLECLVEERWQGGPPLTFVLGPNHQIVFSDTRVTVTDGEQESRTTMIPPEAAPPRIQYTPLDVTRPSATRRHLLQWFQWMPDVPANPSSWTLTWALSEVVGDQWILITFEKSLAVLKGPGKPESQDVTSLVHLQVNASGEAQFTIPGSASPRTEVIPWKGNR